MGGACCSGVKQLLPTWATTRRWNRGAEGTTAEILLVDCCWNEVACI